MSFGGSAQNKKSSEDVFKEILRDIKNMEREQNQKLNDIVDNLENLIESELSLFNKMDQVNYIH